MSRRFLWKEGITEETTELRRTPAALPYPSLPPSLINRTVSSHEKHHWIKRTDWGTLTQFQPDILQHRAPTLLSHPKVTRLTQSPPRSRGSPSQPRVGSSFKWEQVIAIIRISISLLLQYVRPVHLDPFSHLQKSVDNKITLVWKQCKTLMNTDVRDTRRE